LLFSAAEILPHFPFACNDYFVIPFFSIFHHALAVKEKLQYNPEFDSCETEETR
jgi:hypothetical protein